MHLQTIDYGIQTLVFEEYILKTSIGHRQWFLSRTGQKEWSVFWRGLRLTRVHKKLNPTLMDTLKVSKPQGRRPLKWSGHSKKACRCHWFATISWKIFNMSEVASYEWTEKVVWDWTFSGKGPANNVKVATKDLEDEVHAYSWRRAAGLEGIKSDSERNSIEGRVPWQSFACIRKLIFNESKCQPMLQVLLLSDF